MKIILFAYRSLGYQVLKYLIKINSKPILVVVPSKEKKEKNQFFVVSTGDYNMIFKNRKLFSNINKQTQINKNKKSLIFN